MAEPSQGSWTKFFVQILASSWQAGLGQGSWTNLFVQLLAGWAGQGSRTNFFVQLLAGWAVPRELDKRLCPGAGWLSKAKGAGQTFLSSSWLAPGWLGWAKGAGQTFLSSSWLARLGQGSWTHVFVQVLDG